MTKNLNYREWLSLSEEERQAVVRAWNPYEGDGAELLKEAFSNFKQRYSTTEGVIEMQSGLYHGGILIIGVAVKKGYRVRLPRVFEGFPVVKMVR
jgi:hypothetical protein